MTDPFEAELRRAESEEDHKKRLEREHGELLQELRALIPGATVLFGFLLAGSFTLEFADLTTSEKYVYYVTLVSTAVALVLYLAPAAHHRLRFREGDKDHMLRKGNREAIAGTVASALVVHGRPVHRDRPHLRNDGRGSHRIRLLRLRRLALVELRAPPRVSRLDAVDERAQERTHLARPDEVDVVAPTVGSLRAGEKAADVARDRARRQRVEKIVIRPVVPEPEHEVRRLLPVREQAAHVDAPCRRPALAPR